MSQVFISYSRQDEAFVRRLAQALNEANIAVWLDVFHINTGENWSDAIQRGLDASNAMVLVISENSMQSKQVANEWQYYLEEKKAIYPIRLQAAKIHYQLRPLQYIDFLEQSFDEALRELLASLSPKPSTNPEEAMALEILKNAYQNWLNFERSNDLLLDKNRLSRILESLRQFELSESLWRYLMTSIASIRYPLSTEILTALSTLPSEAQTMIFPPLLVHPSAIVRKGLVEIIVEANLVASAISLGERLHQEDHEETILALAYALKSLNAPLDQSALKQAFERSKQWQIRSQLLKLMEISLKMALFVSDGTDLASDFMKMAQESGFGLVQLSPEDLFMLPIIAPKLPSDIFDAYDLVIIMKGEHFSAVGLEPFYARLATYLERGGVLFASSWVAWESKDNGVLAKLLPFKFTKFVENVYINCKPTIEGKAEQLFSEIFSIFTSYEILEPHNNSHVLLEADKGIPVFGYCYVGEGRSFYLNSCQHSCTKPFDAQTRVGSEFKTAFERVFDWLYQIS